MKAFGFDVKTQNFGYFGVRRCGVCNSLQDVDLLKFKGIIRFLFLPIKTVKEKRFLACQKCGACFEINDDLWNYYKTYKERYSKRTTDEILKYIIAIDKDLQQNQINLMLDSEESKKSISMIFNELLQKYNNPNNLEELISVYFSKQ